MARRALVLGGGGVAGIAWQTGVLLGLAEAGADVSDAEICVQMLKGALGDVPITAVVPRCCA